MDEESKGGFLFISHSHKDMDKVRQLRNKLEDEGYDPLCFYLKCLDDDKDELADLIKREIDAREWFVYAVSPNSITSEPVQKERRWRKRPDSKNKQEWKWDLESDFSVDEVSKILIKGLRVHIIFSVYDKLFVDKLKNKLKERDLQVTTDYDITAGKGYIEQIDDMIREASVCGTNIVILSHKSIQSPYILDQVGRACNMDSLLIPVFIDDVKLKGKLKKYLGTKQGIINENPIKDENDLDNFVDMVVDEIRQSLDSYFE